VATAPVPASVDEYIAGFPPDTQRLLRELRAIIKEAVPEATERISYRMPTFDYRGKVLIYFAGFKGHVGVYPIIGAVEVALGDDIATYKYGKGTVRFSLDELLPADLVRRIVQVKASEIEARKKTGAR
jgi:uncharacterized protein YdhG (YjbR/CyaY superfamily)